MPARKPRRADPAKLLDRLEAAIVRVRKQEDASGRLVQKNGDLTARQFNAYWRTRDALDALLARLRAAIAERSDG